jgi:hypothetical protein
VGFLFVCGGGGGGGGGGGKVIKPFFFFLSWLLQLFFEEAIGVGIPAVLSIA